MTRFFRSLALLVGVGCSRVIGGGADAASGDRFEVGLDPLAEDARVDQLDAPTDTTRDDGRDALGDALDATLDRVDAPGDALDVASDHNVQDQLDASIDVDAALDRADVALDRADTAPQVDSPETEAAVDVPRESASPGDADCPRDPPSGPPAGVGQSCGAGRAPAEHCREIAFCGGTYRMGSREAWDVTSYAGGRNLPMRACDLHEAVARGGYVDAYEVSVARYRAWVNAGFPRPRSGERYFNGQLWDIGFNRDLVIPDRATMDGRVPGVPSSDAMCTWSATPGVNDNLPINCVPVGAAVAFCWWEGKHLITEVGWEYLATNRGTTPTPFGAIPAADAVCSRGDVGGYTGHCARSPFPSAIGTHPNGATRDPMGVQDLWGGMQEWVFGLASPYAQYFPHMPGCTYDAPRSVDGDPATVRTAMLRGPAWFQNATEFSYFHHASTRAGATAELTKPEGRTPTSVRVGFRCARWLPEPR